MADGVIHFTRDANYGHLLCRYEDRYVEIPLSEIEAMQRYSKSERDFEELVAQIAWNRMGLTGSPTKWDVRHAPPNRGWPDGPPKTAQETKAAWAGEWDAGPADAFGERYRKMMHELESMRRAEVERQVRSNFDPTKPFDSASSTQMKIKETEAQIRHMQQEMEYRARQEAKADQYEKRARSDDWADAASYTDFNGTWNKPKAKKKTPKSKRREDRIMANKFLPFIVKSSTPQHVYQTLLSRSKGMNINLVTSIFYMTMGKGVEEIREYAKSLPDGMSVTSMYEEMIGKYSQFRILDEELHSFLELGRWLTSENWANVDQELSRDLESKDIMAFLYVMYKLEQHEEYCQLDLKGYVDNAPEILSNIPKYVKFADDGEEYMFTSEENLKAFILHRALMTEADPDDVPIKVIFHAEDEE